MDKTEFLQAGKNTLATLLKAERTDSGPFTIVTATDGNHGRAVARFARLRILELARERTLAFFAQHLG